METREVVKADLGDGRLIQVEVQTTGDPERDVGIRDVLSFEGVVDTIEALTENLMRALRRARPDKATLEFGIDIGVEAGALTALVVKGTGTATVKITLEWAAGRANA
jgi:hypothetical protein